MTGNDDGRNGGFEPGRALVPGPVGGPADPQPTAEYPEVAGSVAPVSGGGPVAPVSGGAVPPAAVAAPRGRLLRGAFWLVATLALIVLIAFGVRAVGLWPGVSNPFGAKTTDRSQPVLLKSIQDLSRFVAAEGNFEVVVDIQDNRKYVPDFLLNDRILFIAAGSVEAYVDFSSIGQGAIKESADHKTVEIKLPGPQLGKPNIDNDRSYVFAEQRGLFNKVGDLFRDDPNRLQELYKLAEDKIGASARDSGLAKRAQDNTTKMLEGMLRSLGYTSVTVTFSAA